MKKRIGFVSNSSTSSFIMIGLKIDRNKLYTTSEKRSCDCDVPGIEEAAFCSSCGVKVKMIETEVPIPEYVDYKIGKFEIQDEREYSDGDAYAIIPGSDETSSDYCMQKIDIVENLTELKAEMKKTFEELEMWNEKEFGIWFGVRSD